MLFGLRDPGPPVVPAARRVAAGIGGRVRIASVETMTAWVLAPVLRSWRRRFPDVEIDLKEYTSADRTASPG
jgi:DNA-binding transcriptional LysR family regulator